MKNNQIKKAVTRYRRANKWFDPYKIPLCHILINIRSNLFSSDLNSWECKIINKILKDKSLCRKSAKGLIIRDFGGRCFRQRVCRKHYGNKTYFIDGQFYSENPASLELPF